MAVNGWIVDDSVVARSQDDAIIRDLESLADELFVCPVSELEQLYSARSADEYRSQKDMLRERYTLVRAPADILERALALQRDLAYHHGMWHRLPIPGLLIAETVLYHGLGVVHIDQDYERIAAIRPLTVRRIG